MTLPTPAAISSWRSPSPRRGAVRSPAMATARPVDGRLHAVQDGAQARIGLGVVGRANEAMDLVVGRQQAGEHGHADEAGGSGEQDRTFGDGHGFSVLLVLVSGVQGGVPPRLRPWAACTDSQRVRWTAGRARVAAVRAFPTMGVARRRNAETRLTTHGLQRSSDRVIGLFDGARNRRAGALDRPRSRRRHGRHGRRRAGHRVARRVGRRCDRAVVGRSESWRAATRDGRGIGRRRGGGQDRPGAVRGHPRRDREAAMAPRCLHGAVAGTLTRRAPRGPVRRARDDDRGAGGRAGGGRRDAQRAPSRRRRPRPGRPRSRAGRPRRARPPAWRRAAIRWRRARRRPRGCSCRWASVPFS